jgi:preprotein translocase subunit SecG
MKKYNAVKTKIIIMFWLKYRHVIYVVVVVVGVVVVVVGVVVVVVVVDSGGGGVGHPAQSVNVSTPINKLKNATLMVISVWSYCDNYAFLVLLRANNITNYFTVHL